MAVIIDKIVLNALETNTYFIRNENSDQVVIVDPGWETKKISEYLSEHGLTAVAVILTHGHFDHILGVPMLQKEGIPLYASERETELLGNPEMNVSYRMRKSVSVTPDVQVKDYEKITLAGVEFQMIPTPGHTEGSVCWYIEAEKMLISGDTLFRESYGRYDFPTGDFTKLKESFENVLFKLPDEVICYPGHGETTTIGHEKQFNPIINGW